MKKQKKNHLNGEEKMRIRKTDYLSKGGINNLCIEAVPAFG